MHHESAHEKRRKLEEAIVDRAMYHELIKLPYKTIPDNLRICPRQGCEQYLKALKKAAALHEARERNEIVTGHQIANVEDEQVEATIAIDSQVAALASDQAQNTYLLTEIRKRLRPDGEELGFESNVEKCELSAKEEDDGDEDGSTLPIGGEGERENMVYGRKEMQEEKLNSSARHQRWFCC
ncbi:hypothetical protein EJ08DRAFT_696343 [Tothia fuscella]|uniref:Uncharacterized protein n=1 Tax=Tothia fuscella TaxID=1048955 RepID=A0A9P4NTU8_9PEZI|nr:hypothetical protein EJ08DRAFT_696343 [Tothia fuscella]